MTRMPTVRHPADACCGPGTRQYRYFSNTLHPTGSRLFATGDCNVRGYLSAIAIMAALSSTSVVSGCVSSQRGAIASLSPDVLADLRKGDARMTAQRPDGPIDTDRAIALALTNSPQLAALRDNVRRAEAQRRAAIQIADPEIGLRYGRDDALQRQTVTVPAIAPLKLLTVPGASGVTTTETDGETRSASLRLFIPNPWMQGYRWSAANAAVMAVEADLRAGEWRLASQVRIACEEVRLCKEQLAASEALVGTVAELEKTASVRLKEGAATVMALTRISRRHVTAIVNRDRMAQTYSVAMGTLAGLIGLPVSSLVLTPDETLFPPFDPSALSLDALRADALRYRLDLSALVWRVHAARAALDEARTAEWPWPGDVRFTAGRTSRGSLQSQNVPWTFPDGAEILIPDPDTVSTDYARDYWSVDAAIVIPIFSLLCGKTSPAQAAYECAKNDLYVSRRTLLYDVEQHCALLKNAWESLAKYQQDGLPRLEGFRTLLRQFESQKDVLPDDVVDIREVIINLEQSKRELESQYRKALLSLSETVGKDVESPPAQRVPAQKGAAAPDESASSVRAP